jgi:hypothetical protein
VAEEPADVVDKQGIKQLGDFLLVRKIERSLEGDPETTESVGTPRMGRTDEGLNPPDTLQMHGTNLDHMPNLFALEDAVAPAAGHAGDIQQLGTVDHMVVCIVCQPERR